MTNPQKPAPGLDTAVSNLIGALNSPQHGAVGTALADLINTIDHMTGANLGATAAQFMSGIDVSAAVANPAPSTPASSSVAQTTAATANGALGAELEHLAQTITARAGDDPKSSYTASLLSAGVEKCAKKLGEEAVETALAAAKGDQTAIANEAADLLYHLLVLLKATGTAPEKVAEALQSRRGVSGLAEKAGRPQ